MNYAWIETSVMVFIFISASLFAIKHFLPEFYGNAWHLLARKKNRGIDINLVAATGAGPCQTKCSACNGCSMAK
ncbi:MAG: hypothetical protein ACREPB_03200 [Arenimonas sp.]